MSWLVHHTRSEAYASQADELRRRHDRDRAVEFYRLAAEAEADALNHLAPSKTRTLGITAVSAVSLYFKAQEFLQARKLAYQWLATDILPPFAVEALEDLLQVIRFEESRSSSDIRSTEGDILITVSGGDVAHGEAPLELFLRKLEQISNILYRTTELMLGLPIRTHGVPSQTVKNFCDPWLLAHSSKEHQFSFALIIRKPQDQSLSIPGLEDDKITTEAIGERFFEIISATVHNPEGEELTNLIPDVKYREIFLKLIRYVAPPSTGTPFGRIELTLNYGVRNISVALSSSTRQVIDAAIKALQMSLSDYSVEEKTSQIRGILRGFQPEKNWIDVRVNGEVKRIYDAGTEIDDVVIPMVNRRVVAEVLERSDKSVEKRYLLRDLQLEEDVV